MCSWSSKVTLWRWLLQPQLPMPRALGLQMHRKGSTSSEGFTPAEIQMIPVAFLFSNSLHVSCLPASTAESGDKLFPMEFSKPYLGHRTPQSSHRRQNSVRLWLQCSTGGPATILLQLVRPHTPRTQLFEQQLHLLIHNDWFNIRHPEAESPNLCRREAA